MRAKLMLVAALVVVLGVSAGTLALFSATSGAANNTFTSGTLSINSVRDQGDTVPGPMFYITPASGNEGGGNGLYPTGYWAPGDTNMRVLVVKNTGSLDAWMTGVRASMHAGSSRHLADKLQVKVTTDSAGTAVIASGTMGNFLDADQIFPSKLSLNAAHPPLPAISKPLYFWVTLPLDADNSYQNETLVVDFTVYAVQKKNNP
jgi:predicted ribosomally synthesized peptide with SipW-like signal peptide